VTVKITVVIPTVAGRETDLARCLNAYHERSVHHIAVTTFKDRPTCAEGWNAGAAEADGDYLHFSADDLEPHKGWDVAAIEACDAGVLPAPRIVNPAGRLDYCGVHGVEMEDWARVQMSVIPFMPLGLWKQIGPVPPIHYYSDNYVSWRAGLAGWPTVVRRGFEFTHHWAKPGRGAGMSYEQRMAHDRAAYAAAVNEVEGSHGAVRNPD
jgi:hypothetical protein